MAALLVVALAGCGAGSAERPGGASGPGVAAGAIVYANLGDVSCAPPGPCVAVGSFLPADRDAAEGDPDGDGQAPHTLVELLGRNGWSRSASPDEGHGGAVLTGVSCAVAGSCVAVGYYEPKSEPLTSHEVPVRDPLIEARSGSGGWRVVVAPAVAPNSVLLGVSCPSSSSCVAVGYATTSPRRGVFLESPLVLSDAAGAWESVPIPAPPASSTGLSAVSCPLAGTCTAVGDTAPASDPTATRPLLEQLAGGSWSEAALGGSAAGPGILYGVSCPAAGRCTAVGNLEPAAYASTALVLRESPSGWGAATPVSAAGGDSSLTTVACATTTACVALGTTAPAVTARPAVLALSLSPGGWQQLLVPGTPGYVKAVACRGVADCLVVGITGSRSLTASITSAGWAPEANPFS